MISLYDRDVFTIYKEEINKEQLLLFFVRGHSTDIVVVYNKEQQFQGIITYERLLEEEAVNLIQKEFVVTDEKLWDKARSVFANSNKIIYLPVLNEKRELVCFCYQSSIEPGEKVYIKIMEDLAENDNLVFIQELYPQIDTVVLHDLNEMAYKFYKLLKKRDIVTVVTGYLWEELFGINTGKVKTSSYKIMNVYAEGTGLIKKTFDVYDKNRFKAPDVWHFLKEIGIVNRILIENDLIDKMMKQGIKVFSCRVPGFEELHNITIDEELRRLTKVQLVHPPAQLSNKIMREQIQKIYPDFAGEISEKVKEIKDIQFKRGSKITEGTGEKRIYVIGPCIVSGYGLEREETLLYLLYKQLNKILPKTYSVRGFSIDSGLCNDLEEILGSLSIQEDDIVIFIGRTYQYLYKKFKVKAHKSLDLLSLFETRHTETWFMDIPIHTTGVANRAIAKEITDKIISPEISKNKENPKCLQRGKTILNIEEKKELNNYLDTIRGERFNYPEDAKIGSIVMNCNPMTLGHMYLIEYASKQVDYLYIFIVQEDKSFFKFQDRIDIVRRAVNRFGNIKVIPSGGFIISNKTLPSYFTKEEEKDMVIDASKDIGIFSEYIAPAMGINIRFVGEEPLDFITNQYNMEMKRTLSDYDIEFIEIPRKQSEGEVISASRVRALLKEGEWNEIKKIVPGETFDYLQHKYL